MGNLQNARDIDPPLHDGDEMRHLTSLFDLSPVPMYDEDFSAPYGRLKELISLGITDMRQYLSTHPEELLWMAANIRIVRANPAVLELFGVRNLDEFRTQFSSFFTGDTMSAFVEFLVRIAGGQTKSTHVEVAVQTSVGESRWLDLSWVVAPEAGHDFSRMRFYFSDITNRKRVEEELRRHQEELEILVDESTRELKTTLEQLHHAQKMEAVGRLAGGIAHDFNNFLATIQGNAEILLQKTGEARTMWENLGRIVNSTKRARGLTRKLLAFSRKDPLNLESSTLEAIATDVLDMLKGSISASRVCLDFNPSPAPVLVDVSQITQALLNLCINACDAMAGQGQLTVQTGMVTESESGKSLPATGPRRFSVARIRDTGPGIPVEHRSRIFEPFFTTKDPDKGTGLGLSVTMGIVEAHGGRLHLLPDDGSGTTMEVWLPVVDAVVIPPRVSPQPLTVKDGILQILVVDDEADVAATARDMLIFLGYSVTTAHSGIQALQILDDTQEGFSLILLDMMMPGMSGIKVFHQIRERVPDQKIILCSGYSRDGQLTELLAAGASAILPKPFTLNDLEQIIAATQSPLCEDVH